MSLKGDYGNDPLPILLRKGKQRDTNIMPKYRTQFEIGLDELRLIEESLTSRVGELSQASLDFQSEDLRLKDCDTVTEKMKELKEIRELLGRLHEQKIWFEPEAFVPRG